MLFKQVDTSNSLNGDISNDSEGSLDGNGQLLGDDEGLTFNSVKSSIETIDDQSGDFSGVFFEEKDGVISELNGSVNDNFSVQNECGTNGDGNISELRSKET